MLAFKNVIFIKFIWREATTRKHEVFSSLALNSYENFNYKELDELTVKAIAGILKVKVNLKKIAKVNEEGKVVYDMCQAFEDYKEEGRREGKREGRREGKREGRREGRREGEVLALKTAVNNLMKNQKVTFETAAEMLGISKSTQKKLLS